MSRESDEKQLLETIDKQNLEIRNLKRSLSAQVAINRSMVAEIQMMKGQTAEQISRKLKQDEEQLRKSESESKKKDRFT